MSNLFYWLCELRPDLVDQLCSKYNFSRCMIAKKVDGCQCKNRAKVKYMCGIHTKETIPFSAAIDCYNPTKLSDDLHSHYGDRLKTKPINSPKRHDKRVRLSLTDEASLCRENVFVFPLVNGTNLDLYKLETICADLLFNIPNIANIPNIPNIANVPNIPNIANVLDKIANVPNNILIAPNMANIPNSERDGKKRLKYLKENLGLLREFLLVKLVDRDKIGKIENMVIRMEDERRSIKKETKLKMTEQMKELIKEKIRKARLKKFDKTSIKKEKKDCECCFEEVEEYISCNSNETKHTICSKCLNQYFQSSINDGNIRNKCPICDDKFDLEEVSCLISEEIYIKLEESQKTEELFYLAKVVPQFQICPFCKLYGLSAEENVAQIQCELCKKYWCPRCKRKGHGKGKVDKSYCLVAEDKKMLDMILDDIINKHCLSHCPSCNVSYVKTDGCNLIHCSKCNVNSCHICNLRIDPKTKPDGSPDKYWHFGEKCKLYDSDDIARQNEIKSFIEKNNDYRLYIGYRLVMCDMFIDRYYSEAECRVIGGMKEKGGNNWF